MDRVVMTATDQSWSMDFVSDALFDGRKFRSLTIIDNFSRECLVIEVDQSITGEDVVRIPTKIARERNQHPQRIQADNGPEFVSLALDKWAYENGVVLDFSRPGKPTDNPFIESFNGSFRDECFKHQLVYVARRRTKKDRKLETGLLLFPHSSLADTASAVYAKQLYESQPSRIF